MPVAATFAAPAPLQAPRWRGEVPQRRCRVRRRQGQGRGRQMWRGSAGRGDPYEGRSAALARWRRAEGAHAGGAEAFRMMVGRGAASAVRAVYPTETRVLVLCGGGRNGEVGLHAAAALSGAGFATAAYQCVEHTPAALVGTCVDHLAFVPSTAEYYFDVAVDAVLGIGYDGGEVRGNACVPFEFVVHTRLPVVSLDVPSGWDVDSGPREIDVMRDEFVKPRLLVSLGVPKRCARMFAGALHYVYDWETGAEEAALFASNAKAFVGHNGEVYGRPGMFEATLFTKREGKRTWVYTEDDEDDFWDELD